MLLHGTSNRIPNERGEDKDSQKSNYNICCNHDYLVSILFISYLSIYLSTYIRCISISIIVFLSLCSIFYFHSVILAALGGILFYDVGFDSTTLVHYADTLGYMSSLLVVIQWSPQIWTTFKMKV